MQKRWDTRTMSSGHACAPSDEGDVLGPDGACRAVPTSRGTQPTRGRRTTATHPTDRMPAAIFSRRGSTSNYLPMKSMHSSVDARVEGHVRFDYDTKLYFGTS